MSNPTIKLSERMSRIQPSITMAVTSKAKQLKAEGVDIVSFGAGEPDFDTPDHIKDAARRALDEGVAKYTHVAGLPALREACATELNKAHGTDLSADNIIVTTGAKQSLYNLFMAMLDDGDEVIIPAPYWVSYPDMVKLAGGKPVIVETSADNDFQMTAEALSAAITDRTRAVVLNTPSNPTGAVYTRATLEALAAVIVERKLWVVSDDIYRSLVYGDTEYVSIGSLGPDIAARTIFIDGVSKTYAMTGWRIGYTGGPAALIKTMAKLQGQSTSNAAHISQRAALEAISGSQECVAEMKVAFDERRKRIVAMLNDIEGVTCRTPKGAFYAFPNVSSYVGKKTPDGAVLEDDVALCTYLVDQGVAIVPGSGFGAPGFARLSYATSMADIEKGVARLGDALKKLG